MAMQTGGTMWAVCLAFDSEELQAEMPGRHMAGGLA